MRPIALVLSVLVVHLLAAASFSDDQPAVALPPGVKAVWDLEKAHHQKSATRERICLNGLWRWQPVKKMTDEVPAANWGYFKVPGSWPGTTDYMQMDCQTVFAHPTWKSENLGGFNAAWYQREVAVPAGWTGRVALYAEYVNSFATVWIDGKKIGQVRFPAGEVDLTAACPPGTSHVLSISVLAVPLKAVRDSFADTNAPKLVNASVQRRGLCGDVYLDACPAAERIADVKIDTSTRKWEVRFDAAVKDMVEGARYTLGAKVSDGTAAVAEFTSKPFTSADVKGGRIAFIEKWKPQKLWDTSTPQNVYQVSVSLLRVDGKVADAALPIRFGFRELWVEGRDFFLNGTRVHLPAVPLDNPLVGAAWANYDGSKETLERLKSFGINFVYSHNYDCLPGSHLSYEETLRAADDVGMLVALAQPQFGDYEWKAPDADAANGYARDAEFYIRVAQNHPSVVMYAMSHNAVGAEEEMNPDYIDGIQDRRGPWSSNQVKLAVRAEAIVHRLDPARVIYHHSGANLGVVYTMNFYANFAPVQEMSDWFAHWSTQGVKPLFLCEYGVPMTWDWALYRGWYKGKREFGSAAVPWELCESEWNAQFLGDRAFAVSDRTKNALRFEAKNLREGKGWFRWDYPGGALDDHVSEERHAIFSAYMTNNYRAFRALGVSGYCPWDHGHYWTMRRGLNRNAVTPLKVDWDNLQRPGLSADYIERRYEVIELSYDRADWEAAASAQALTRNLQPLLAYIGGKPSGVTSKDHNFLPGQTVEKQLVVLNDSREAVTAECAWSLGLPTPMGGSKKVTIATGEQERVPMRFDLPLGLQPGAYRINAVVKFSNGVVNQDVVTIDVLPQLKPVNRVLKTALWDPRGETAAQLAALGIRFEKIDAKADLSAYDTVIIGKSALTTAGPGLDMSRVGDGLKVIVFEQAADVLERRFGFRVVEYGLRDVYKRVPDHPALAGLQAENLSNWTGEATLIPPRIKYVPGEQFNLAPTAKWCGIDVTTSWRAGNRGSVASVLIEKPACGDFTPIVDGGFGLRYSPLLEYREGGGMVLFCQLDVTGRTEADPAATRVVANILDYVAQWKPTPSRKALYAGERAGLEHLKKSGLDVASYDGGALGPEAALIVGPGGGRGLAPHAAAVAEWLRGGGRVLAVGLDEAEANAFLPAKIHTTMAEYVADLFEPAGTGSPFTGIGPADVYNRDPRQVPLVSGGATAVGSGVLAGAADGVVFCQLAPWRFGYTQPQGVKRTFRTTSSLLSRMLGNLGVHASTPLLKRFDAPVDEAKNERRWLDGLYLDVPDEWDNPYRAFCW
jgi:beta-galactosidase